MKARLFLSAAAAILAVAAAAQDPNERVYNYELLNPQGNTRNISPKPKVAGWAQERVKEPLDRGVVAVRTDEGVYVGWRLLETDDPSVTFNVYRTTDGRRFRKVNSRPVSATTDFLDRKAPAGSSYQVRAVAGR